jgi:Protein of unknown function (DUF1573)
MKQAIFTILILAATVSSTLMAQNGPMMVFEKTEIDYGTVSLNSEAVRVFKFKNTGTEPLVIKNARGSCGCTIPKWSNEPIKAGQTGVIEVKYDTSRPGSFSKPIYVETNETNPNHNLSIKGNVADKATTASNGSGSKR